MQHPRIVEARAIDNHTLVVYFSNQEIRQYDIRHLLTREMFAPLQQPTFFKNFKVEPGGYALVWNEDIDISEYELRKNGTELSNDAEETRQPFERYAKNDDAVIDAILARVPDVSPIEGDEILP